MSCILFTPRVFCSEPVFSQADAFRCDAKIERLRFTGTIVSVESRKDQFLSSYFLIEKLLGGKPFILNLQDLH